MLICLVNQVLPGHRKRLQHKEARGDPEMRDMDLIQCWLQKGNRTKIFDTQKDQLPLSIALKTFPPEEPDYKTDLKRQISHLSLLPSLDKRKKSRQSGNDL
jgi:hypothetical protein